MGKIFWCAFLFFAGLADAHEVPSATKGVCADLLNTPGLQSIYRQVETLWSPSASVGVRELSLSELYLLLKSEEWALNRTTLAPDLQTRIGQEFATSFDLTDASPEEATRFYRNVLRGLYIRVARLWKIQEVRGQWGSKTFPELESLGAALIDTYFSPYGLSDAELRPEEARSIFSARPWFQYPWAKVQKIYLDWKQMSAQTAQSLAEAMAHGFESSDFSWEQWGRLERAVHAGPKGAMCCHSEPGCTLCPLNRAWRRNP